MKDQTTEQKILEAARQVFVQKGMDGARMQEIADIAGINKALLHYYFRSKDKLFFAVFESVMGGFFKLINLTLQRDEPIEVKIDFIVDSYLDTLDANPFVPQFIISEVSRNPNIMKELLAKNNFHPNQFVQLFNAYKKENTDPRQLFISFMGMMLFPYIAAPMLKMILFDNSHENYAEFLGQRKDFVKSTIKNILQL